MMPQGLDCVYDEGKAKPGLRTGAIENLTQRVGKYLHSIQYQVNGKSNWDSYFGKHVPGTGSPLATDVESYGSGNELRLRLLAIIERSEEHTSELQSQD